MIVNCFRYLGFTSLYDIQTLSLYEYEARMYAYRLKQVDKRQEMHMQAWLNHQVTATKEQGKNHVSVYKNFKDFFDYEKELREVEKPSKSRLTPHMRKLAQIAKKANVGRR